MDVPSVTTTVYEGILTIAKPMFQYYHRQVNEVNGGDNISRDRFQRERLGRTASPNLFRQWERRSQECNSPLVICYTFVNMPRLRPNWQFAMLSLQSV